MRVNITVSIFRARTHTLLRRQLSADFHPLAATGLCSLPLEILLEVAQYVMHQCSMDLLSLGRTASSLRKAARLVGRSEISKYALLFNPGDRMAPFDLQESPSPLLQSTVQALPYLDFPAEEIPGSSQARLDKLPRCFRTRKQLPTTGKVHSNTQAV